MMFRPKIYRNVRSLIKRIKGYCIFGGNLLKQKLQFNSFHCTFNKIIVIRSQNTTLILQRSTQTYWVLWKGKQFLIL